MANMEQVQIVKRGRDAVALWREEHQGENFDLHAAYLSYARLAQVDLRGSDLRDSDLMGATLPRANLSGCRLNPCHMYRADLRQANLSRSLINGANLRGANLQRADLSESDMDRAVLSDANLSGANLRGTNLSRTNLTGANFTDADLTGAVLHRAALTRATLDGAILDNADFYEATFNDVGLSAAKFAGSIVGYTVFQNCDLSTAEGLDQVRHDAPSSVGLDTLYRSGGRIEDIFLRNAGIPESILEFQGVLLDAAQLSGDFFISCASGDAAAAQALQADLQSKGVRCWVFSEDFRGSALVERHSTSDQEEVERWLRDYDKLVVICTDAAFDSEKIRNDITQAQQLQQSKDEWLLYLVDPTGQLGRSRNRLARTLSSEHVVFDLGSKDSDPEKYQGELSRLAESLLTAQPRSAGVPSYEEFQL